ncbi:low temperature requirement protein A (plasmid) [Ensifer adhaerens]|uniref:low temperature requirement protein A n=1 Tax=Ensifer adhaerens TaxID=106592 RepID=UPI001CBFA2CD|nr:low temperature requirement protein A [Ensifer adhaerens]MBZ7927518.1 low temperature requirement protein A [Ensifer adhaerens]UAX97938.1 low temperature requirement protein A [Ensifer adhaerens]UAY05317.1 low temperature requirement protein A [Ensifer adhaerens]UAY12695.1 low temperature requirement protein A [Ensifer adhaerens]
MSAEERRPSWIRGRDAQETKASFPELFFDLVFVFGLIQLSHTLAADFTSATAGEALLLVLAIWWLWINTTWVTNLLNPDSDPVRYMLFASMFAGILMAIALPNAFGNHAFAFAAAYSAIQIGRSIFTVAAFRRESDETAGTFVRITLWAMISGALWIAGAFLPFEARVIAWMTAIATEYAAPLLHYWVPVLGRAPRQMLILSGEHLAERCALFVIICLGETILTTGRNAADYMGGDLTFVVFCSAFVSTVAMWWVYFNEGQEAAAEKADNAAELEPVAHNLFTYGHLPIVAGIILTAVGQDYSLSHAQEDADLKTAFVVLGGPALFLCGSIWVKVSAIRRLPVSHAGALVTIGLLLATFQYFPTYLLNLGATTSLVTAATWDYAALRWPFKGTGKAR